MVGQAQLNSAFYYCQCSPSLFISLALLPMFCFPLRLSPGGSKMVVGNCTSYSNNLAKSVDTISLSTIVLAEDSDSCLSYSPFSEPLWLGESDILIGRVSEIRDILLNTRDSKLDRILFLMFQS